MPATEATMDDDDEKLIARARRTMLFEGCGEDSDLAELMADRLSALKADLLAERARTQKLGAEADRLLFTQSHLATQNAEQDRINAVLAAECDRMREALREAEATFRGYAALHASKSPPAIDKARANAILADRMLAALSQEPTQ